MAAGRLAVSGKAAHDGTGQNRRGAGQRCSPAVLPLRGRMTASGVMMGASGLMDDRKKNTASTPSTVICMWGGEGK